MMLEATVHTVWGGIPYLIPVLAVVGALFSAAYSFRYIVHVFLGPVREDYPAKPHDPGVSMWLAPAVLVVLVVAIGLFSAAIVGPLVATASGAVIGGDLPYYSLKLWHGWVPALFMSIIAVLGGIVLLWQHRALNAIWLERGPPFAKAIYDALVDALVRGCRRVTDGLHTDALTRYGAIFVVFTLALAGYAYATGTMAAPTRALLPVGLVPMIGWICLIGSACAVVLFHHNRLLSLVVLGVVGLMVSLMFNYLSAPDLALTQISVEVVTIILLLLALNFMPKETPRDERPARLWRDGAIAAVGGLAATGLAYALMVRDFAEPSISGYHLANSKTEGGGTNVVNVILVDFRGFDTFGEIIVLGIAAIIIYAVTESILDSRVRAQLLNRKPDFPIAGDAHPLMMVVATRVMMPIALMVAAYIFFRGHNLPGGGFIAGLVAAIALVMQYMASGFAWASARQRYPYHAIIGCGVLIAAATGIGAWFNDLPFLTSAFGYVAPLGLNEFELATAMAFDLGVFLTVVGAVLLALESLSRYAWQPGMVSEYPMDINPARDDPTAVGGAGGAMMPPPQGEEAR
jgi:multicomponent K+:H+ antiporter subunit A